MTLALLGPDIHSVTLTNPTQVVAGCNLTIDLGMENATIVIPKKVFAITHDGLVVGVKVAHLPPERTAEIVGLIYADE